jgi:hypothetical protein
MKNILVVVGLFFSTFLVAEEVLYCVPELSTGFIYENNTFKAGNFKKNRFTVKVYGDFEKIDTPSFKQMPCEKKDESIYICTDKYNIGMNFVYNKSNSRFIAYYISQYGYLNYPSDDGYDTDTLQAGKCEKF